MTTLYDNDSEFQHIESSKNVSPQATRWLWGFLIFMVSIFFITGVLTSHKDMKLSEMAYHDVLLAKEAISSGHMEDAKILTKGLSRVYGGNWHVLYLNALIAFKEGNPVLQKSSLIKSPVKIKTYLLQIESLTTYNSQLKLMMR